MYLRNIAPPAENPFAGWPAYVVPHVLAVLPTGTIQYKLATDAHVTLQVFDVRGRLVRGLVSSPQTAQLHEVAWNGRDDRGIAAGSGVFFVRLQTRPLQRPGEIATFTRKLVRLD